MWPDERVVAQVNRDFVPARLRVKEDAAEFKRFGERYGALWTPSILMLDPSGVERHRIEGFLPADDFLAQLTLGLGHLAFQSQAFRDAERHFAEVLERFPESEGAPEAQYWVGVSRYKASGEAKELSAVARAFESRYGETGWAKKASVWRSA